MKTLSWAFLALILTTGTALAGEQVEATISADPDATVEIENLSGSVTIQGWDQNQVKVTGVVGDDTEGLSTSGEGRHIQIKVKIPKGHSYNKRDFESHLEIWVPTECQLEVETVSGSIKVDNVNGRLELDSVSGSIEASGAPRAAIVETVSGGIRIAGSQTAVTAESVSGRIHLEGVAEKVEAATVSGRVEVEAGEIERGDFESVSGSIVFSGSFAAGAHIDMETHSGNITLEVPSDTSASFEVSTFSGHIDNELGPEASRVSKYGPGRRLEFSTGSGDAQVSIEAFSGNVSLRRK